MIKTASFFDVAVVARGMRPHDRAERLALSSGDDPVLAATHFLSLPHLAVTVWRDDRPVAVIGAVYAHPGVASTIFFATDEFPRVALSTTRWIRKTLFPALLAADVHRLQVCSMGQAYHVRSHDWIWSFGARPEAVLQGYGKNREDFTLYTIDHAGMARVTSGEN